MNLDMYEITTKFFRRSKV